MLRDPLPDDIRPRPDDLRRETLERIAEPARGLSGHGRLPLRVGATQLREAPVGLLPESLQTHRPAVRREEADLLGRALDLERWLTGQALGGGAVRRDDEERDHQRRGQRTPPCREARPGHQAWPRDRSERGRRLTEQLLPQLRAFHARSDESYGAPRLLHDLRDVGERVGQKRIARLMRQAQLVGVSKVKGPPRPKRETPECPPAPDLVHRRFVATAPNQLWVADMTYIPTYRGFLYLAIVLDVFSRRIVGWAMDSRMQTALVLDALKMAAAQRQPTDVIHHSDQGSQYRAIAFGHRCEVLGVRPSMGSRGDAYDNAMAESFFSTLEAELLAKHRFESPGEAQLKVFRYIEGWYNPHRRHSALGQRSPNRFEQSYLPVTPAAA